MTFQHVHGPPDKDDTKSERYHVAHALNYFRNNTSHMDYPSYRRGGLPITSDHIESTVKQINRRIKVLETLHQRAGDATAIRLSQPE